MEQREIYVFEGLVWFFVVLANLAFWCSIFCPEDDCLSCSFASAFSRTLSFVIRSYFLGWEPERYYAGRSVTVGAEFPYMVLLLSWVNFGVDIFM